MAAKPASQRPQPRLYLATPPVDDPASLAQALPGLLSAADVAAVLVRFAPGSERDIVRRAKALAGAVQEAGAALLLDGHAPLVARAGADGAHVTGVTAMQEALAALKPDRIVGAGGLTTRHDAMVAGEAGADYVLFGEKDTRGARPSAEAVAERLQWWAEVFEPPCVGYAATRDEARAFAAAGADFILVDDLVWRHPDGPRAGLIDAAAALAEGYAASAQMIAT